MTKHDLSLSDLSDESRLCSLGLEKASPRLAAVLSKLPPRSYVRIANRIQFSGIYTLTALCGRHRADLRRWKNFGTKSLEHLVDTLTLFGLSLKDDPHVHVLDVNVQKLHRWIDEYLKQIEILGRSDARAVNERDILTDVMLVLDGREPTLRRGHLPVSIAERCTQIADAVVPTYRGPGPYSCTGAIAKRWQAAWDGACIALGHSPKDYRAKGTPT